MIWSEPIAIVTEFNGHLIHGWVRFGNGHTLPNAGANARHLTSRNKREGEYMGRGHYDRDTGTYVRKWRHQRTGPGPLPPGILSLKRYAIVWGRS